MDAGISVYTVGMAIVGTFIVDVTVAMLAIVVARYYRPGGRRAGPPARRVGPSPRNRRVAPAPRNNFRDNRHGIRDRRMAPPPRSNNLRGPSSQTQSGARDS